MRYLTLSFDDGFRHSSLKTAELYEKHGLRAEFNVLAAPTGSGIGDFGLWNELQARGHVIQPHGYNHTDKSKLPLAEAQDLIRRCLDVFGERLAGFRPSQAIFNFPYNASTHLRHGCRRWCGRSARDQALRSTLCPGSTQ